MTEIVNGTTVGSYRADVRFGKPPAAVFAAFTTVEGLARWWTEQVSGSGAQGGELTLAFPNSDGPRVVLHVDSTEPERGVVWSVAGVPPLPAWEEWAGTRILVRLRPDGPTGTTMEFEHEGLTPHLHCYDTCSRGWDGVLTSLQNYVERGTGNPYR